MPANKQFDIEETLQKAMFAFWQHGYAATSMQDLVDAMGIKRGSLYATYGDKHELFIKALQHYSEHFRKLPIEKLMRNCTPLDAIKGWLTAASRAGPRGCFIANSALELVPHDKEVSRIVGKCHQELLAFFKMMIESGKELGQFSKVIDSEQAAYSLLNTLFGLTVLSRGKLKPEIAESIIEDALSVLN